MKQRKIFKSASGRIVIVRHGFSWPACLFGSNWAYVKRTWGLCFYLTAVALALYLLDKLVVQPFHNIYLGYAMLALNVIYMYVCGRYGNQWLAAALLKKGYKEIGSP